MSEFDAAEESRTRSAANTYVTISIGSLRRNLRLVGTCLGACLALALLYILVRPDSYTARSQVLLDRRELQIAAPDTVYTISTISVPWVQTQVELLRSEKIALRVVQQLKLDADPEFFQPSLFSQLRNALWTNTADSLPPSFDTLSLGTKTAVYALQRRLSINRVGDTYLVDIRATTSDPDKSARIDAATTQAYLDEANATFSAIADGSSAWLRDRVRAAGASARVVSGASAPLRRDPPGALLLLALSGIFGLGLGAALAIAKDHFDPKVRTPEALQNALQAECLGIIPHCENWRKSSQPPKRNGGDIYFLTPDYQTNPLLDRTIDRAAAVLECEKRVRNVGITSVAAGEGKSLVACRLAAAAAVAGRRVLLVDAAGGSGSISSRIAGQTQSSGLLSVLSGDAKLEDAVVRDAATRLDILPLAGGKPISALALGGQRLDDLLVSAGAHYNLVVFDLPAIAPAPTVRAAAHSLEAIVLVTAWGRTDQQNIVEMVAAQPAIQAKLAGVVLNDVEMASFLTNPAAVKWTGHEKSNLRTMLRDLMQGIRGFSRNSGAYLPAILKRH